MILEAGVARVEIAAALLFGQSEALVIVQRGHPVLEPAAQRQRLEDAVRDLVLGRDPGGDLRVVAHIILEPTVGIGDLYAEMILDDVDRLRLRINEGWCGLRRLRSGSDWRGHEGHTRQQDDGQDIAAHELPPRKTKGAATC